MPALSRSEMLAAESSAWSRGWTEEQVLDIAGKRLGLAIARYFKKSGTAIAYLGKGHNAGDAVVALRRLRDQFGWKVSVRHSFPPEQWAPLLGKKCAELGAVESWSQLPDWREMDEPLVIIDGLLGCGGHGPLRGKVLELADEIQWLRLHAGAKVASVDLPSGLDPDTGLAFPGAVTADITFMIAHAKTGLLLSHAANHTGALAMVPVEPLDPLPEVPGSSMEVIAPQTMDFGKAPRAFDFHKGMAGRISVVAGSVKYSGAAILAATGALRGGGGLITLHVPEEALSIISAKCPPEIMVRPYRSLSELHNVDCDAWAIGCGLGKLCHEEGGHLSVLISTHPSPAVLDADALNALAEWDQCHCIRPHHILTPHPGEFRRLAPNLAHLSREQAIIEFAKTCPATLLLKGGRTLIAGPGTPIWCNSTGTPAMACGGQGDLLAGVIGACLASGMGTMEAAACAAWTCGRASELALGLGASEESLTPSDTAGQLGRAFCDWRSASR